MGFSPAAAVILAWGVGKFLSQRDYADTFEQAGSFGPTYKRGVTQGFIMLSDK